MKKFQKLINLTLITSLTCSPLTVYALEKSETIYSNLNYDGSSYKTVVSNHLSWLEEGPIEDDSQLKNILNINGDETFEQNATKLSWKSMGKDIFYQGETEKELPIKTEIKYYLNEEEKTVDEMLGKEGKVKIEIQFQNTIKNTVSINGRNTELYTPFVTTIGTMLDSQNNKNITINNGKIINTGTRNMIIGLASPGLYNSLKLKDLKELDHITLSYETTNFSLSSIYIVSTPKLLEDTDLKIFDKMDELYNNMYELQKNMDLLEKGAKELENGAGSLVNGSKELANSLKNANSAIESLKKGASTLDNGLKEIISSLKNAQNELKNTNFEKSLTDLTILKKQNTNTINTLIAKTGMQINQLTALYNQNKLAEYSGKDETLLQIKSTYEMIMLLTANNTAIDTTITQLKQLTNKINTLILTLNEALTSAEKGANQLNSGLTSLKNGINQIYNGSVKLNNGTAQLYQGATTLSTGTSKLNKQGINKLNGYVNTLRNYSSKIEALAKLSENYKGFTSTNSNSTNFVSVIKSAKITYQR